MPYILRLNAGKQEARQEKVADQDILMAGRGLIAAILNREVNPLCHPLSGENKLVLAPGLFAGTMAPSFGRISVGGKSPLTYGIKEANAGGTAAQKLDRLGIRAVVIEGKPEDHQFYIVKIDGKGCEFVPVQDMAHKKNYDLAAALQARFGEKVGIISIGPCGEERVSAATVAVTDQDGRPTRHAARGGLGAVMGAKGIKAIVIDDSDTPRVDLKDSQAFQNGVKNLVEVIKADKGSAALNRALGTPGVIPFVTKVGSMPTNNYRAGSFDQAENFFGKVIKETNTQRGGKMHGCMPGCIVQCSIVFNDPQGHHLTSALEYETLAMMGSNLGIGDLDAVARIDRRCDDLGIDTIEIGSAIAQAMEAGLVSSGDPESVLGALDEIEKGTPFGRILGQGAAVTARVFGLERVPAVLGQAIPAHDPRACKPVGVTYATSAMGADHTAGIDYRDSLSKEGQVKKSKEAQIFMATMDTVGYCMLALPAKAPALIGILAELLNARYGLSLSGEEVLGLGIKTIREELAFNRAAGLDPGVDRLPGFLKTEVLPPQGVVFDVPREEIEAIWEDLQDRP